MQAKTPREQAILFIAAYEHASDSDYEKQIVRIARRWLKMVGSRLVTQGQVNKLIEEFENPPAESGGAWDDLRACILAWARANGWLEE
jgi:hypothetical protein